MPADPLPHVVIIGGGFGGLAAARGLDGAPCRVTLVDASNHHLFQPLLYQVATAGLSAPDIAAPIRRVLAGQANLTVRLDRARAVNRAAQTVDLGGTVLRYDHLILAAGAVNNYFGHPEWERVAPGLKTLGDALEMRRRILMAFEAAEKEEDPARQREHLSFVVIGGGATGVELAGAIAEIARTTLARDFKNFDSRKTRVILVEGGDRVLGAFSPESSARAARQLERLGVELRYGNYVQAITAEGVQLGAEWIPARTVLWGAGVRGAPVAATLGVPLDRAGRVPVEPDLRLGQDPRVTVIGDLAACAQPGGGQVPGVAPAALQMGALAAKNVRATLAGQPTTPFTYVDKGSLATIGRKAAVAELWGFKLSGLLAWLLWVFVHVLFLVGFRNRVAVLSEWAWAYLSFQRSARVILSRPVDAPGRGGDPGGAPVEAP